MKGRPQLRSTNCPNGNARIPPALADTTGNLIRLDKGYEAGVRTVRQATCRSNFCPAIWRMHPALPGG